MPTEIWLATDGNVEHARVAELLELTRLGSSTDRVVLLGARLFALYLWIFAWTLVGLLPPEIRLAANGNLEGAGVAKLFEFTCFGSRADGVVLCCAGLFAGFLEIFARTLVGLPAKIRLTTHGDLESASVAKLLELASLGSRADGVVFLCACLFALFLVGRDGGGNEE